MPDLIESPDLQHLGKQALQDLLNNLTQAKAFAVEQAPDFCQQLIARGLWMPLLSCALCLLGLLLAASLMSSIFVFRKRWSLGLDDAGCLCLLPAIVSVFLTMGTVVNAHAALAVYVAPKVFLVEEISRMVR